MVEDRHAFGKDSAVCRHQCRGLADRIDSQIALALHNLRHLNPAEPVRLAQPFDRDDRAEGASRGHSVEKNGFHCLITIVDEIRNVNTWTLRLSKGYIQLIAQDSKRVD